MSALLLLIAFAVGQTKPDKPVTEADKKEFLKVLSRLPSKGEFFTDEAIPKAVPYLRVLFALTDKDLEKYDVYPFLAVSSGLKEIKEARLYATANFGKITHPTIKQFWALQLFQQAETPPEVAAFLRKALDSKSEAQMLSLMLGPEFEAFKDDVIRASEIGKLMKVELVKHHPIQAFPKYGGGGDYDNNSLVFASGPLIHAVHPAKQRGELITYDLTSRTTTTSVVPQPRGFKPPYDVGNFFDDPILTVNTHGDLFCRWMMRGSDDLGFGLRLKGSDSFQVRRVDFALHKYSHLAAGPDAHWYLTTESLGIGPTVYQLDKDLREKRLTSLSRASVLNARVISNDALHFFFSGVVGGGGGLRCADFDLQHRRWLHNRALLKLGEFAWPNGGTVLQSREGTLHYVWGISDERSAEEVKQSKQGLSTGLYYQSEEDGVTIKICDACEHRAIAVGDRIVVCYTQKNAPEKVFFRVIRHSALGPVTEIAAAKGQKEYSLGSARMALYSEADRIWFVNTLSPNSLYELKLVDAPQSKRR